MHHSGARGAECAGELGGSDMFYAYLDEAFKETDFNRDSVLAIAGKIGLETEAFTACFLEIRQITTDIKRIAIVFQR